MKLIIRRAEAADWAACWTIIEPVFAAGETYPYENLTESDTRALWFDLPLATFVAVDDAGEIVGTYTLKPNMPGRGAHVCNCGYIVSPAARGKGVAFAMCKHSQHEALESGFTAMQFNFVVSTNHQAIALWQKLGFEIIGTLPKVFRHARNGFVDAHIMFKQLA